MPGFQRGARGTSFKPDYVYVPHEAKMQQNTMYTRDYCPHDAEQWEWCRAAPIRHRECIGREEGPFDANTTMRDDFRKFEKTERAMPIKPVPNEIGGGEFDSHTTYKQEFKAKPTSAPATRERPAFKPNPVPFVGQSTTFAMYRPHPEATREKSFKPQTEYKPCPERFDQTTTASNAYQAWPVQKHEKPQWALQKSYQAPTESFEKHSSYREEYQRPGSAATRAELQKPRGSGLKLAPSSEGLEPSHTLYQQQFVAYGGAEPPKSFKVVQEYQPPTEAVQRESMYQSEYQGRNSERSKPCIPTANKAQGADKAMNFDTTYKDTYQNRPDRVNSAAGVTSGVKGRGSQFSLYDVNTSNNANHEDYYFEAPRRKAVVQRVAAGISSERMSRPMVNLRNASVAEPMSSRIPRSKSVDRATYKRQLQEQRNLASREHVIPRQSATTTASKPTATGSTEPKPIRGGPRVKAASIENILDDSSSYKTADTHVNSMNTNPNGPMEPQMATNITISESRGVSLSHGGPDIQQTPNGGFTGGDMLSQVPQDEVSEYGSAVPDTPAIEAF